MRPSKLPGGEIRIERVNGGGADVLAAPSYVSAIPAHTDLVLVCVRSNQIDGELASTLRSAPAVPVVVVTPMLPGAYAQMHAALGARLLSALPSVTGYTNADGTSRSGRSRAAKTLVDEPRPSDPAATGFVAALQAAGIDARFELGAHEVVAATMIAFLPLLLGLDAAGSLDALLSDGKLATTFRAFDEARAVAETSGKVASWASSFSRFLGPYTVKMGVALARRRAPEALAFVDERFGRSAHEQTASLAREVLALAEETRVRHEALSALVGRIA